MEEALYIGTAAMGFSVSMQFATGWGLVCCCQIFICVSCLGYSWLAEQVDLTGSRGSVVFLGANSGPDS